ncbi:MULTISPECIES: ABC transporter substrate-binding protein [unclassified Mesorhizobium]|uniref:ABC transporter substrate-binding protein n=1 Tax=unclassified Mesorhizobium TaxID=325217 RepID=UPI000BAEC939|nr:MULTISPECIES: ABC transporter substrate-binding protein [unclassified Mesorhizobium]TGT57360.1 ABC transporter substrate-binding protein [Mesorhizobium sp. M00.F.Ca.ET.170.01.1.1]AZO13160.1 ABC transporter substrate-binding protein [Mesorhizobium sp. M3A.F.Ca.ET.080.04.2.1]PBB86199.1 ABC transporter substrate-binding protein [Mesorhizobium sp. WSM3876]RWB73311.1 MAG: ABC transporter substrate-binding protein [Mesorhizobium sp.]RWB82763.1 MAG: ABC transporter substrate-binding protein [Mesor
MKLFHAFVAFAAGALLLAAPAWAVDLSIVSGDTGNGIKVLREILDRYEKQSGNKVNIVVMPSSTTDQFGQYRLWLAAGNTDIDVYQTDVIWAPQLASQLVDLTAATKDVVGAHFPSIIQSQTVNGKLVALPIFTDAPALYYRKDLLDKYGAKVPTTWKELADSARLVMDKERAAGNKDIWGFVFQGNAYEGLTCDALEWVTSNGGGQIIEPDGTVSINNPKAVAVLDMAKGWIGSISPPGVLAYQEEESRGVWQTGNAVFMRNWPYAYALGNGADSPIKGKFDVVPLPAGTGEGARPAATLGGWNLAVSKYSQHPDAAIDMVKFIASPEMQKYRTLKTSNLPTIEALYEDADIAREQPIIPRWKQVFLNAVPRPSAAVKIKYNEASSQFWTAVHKTLSGEGNAADNLADLEARLTKLKGKGW